MIAGADTHELAAGSLELWLTVERPRGTPEDVLVSLPAQATADALTAALAQRWKLEGTAALGLLCDRLGPLNGHEEIARAGLRHGDRLRLVPDGEAGAANDTHQQAGTVQIVVRGGPAAGRRIALATGRHFVGRDRDCAVRLGEDSSLSRRHLELRVSARTVRVRDLESTNGSSINGQRLAPGSEVTLAAGDTITIGRSLLAFQRSGDDGTATTPRWSDDVASDGTVPFNREPRVATPAPGADFDLGAVPARGGGLRPPLGAAVVPLVMGGAMAFLMKQPTMLMFALFSPAMVLWTFVADRHSGRSRFKRERAAFLARLATVKADGEQARVQLSAQAALRNPDPAELAARAQTRADLWQRRRGDEDFLSVRLGVADQHSGVRVTVGDGGEQALQQAAREVIEELGVTSLLPVAVSMPQAGVLGLCGPDHAVTGLGRSIALQAGILHSPRELAIAAVMSTRHVAGWEWLKWLPHTSPGEAMAADSQLASTPISARDVLKAIEELVQARQADMGDRFGVGADALGPAVLVLIDEAVRVERSRVEVILRDGPAVGVYTVWLGSERRNLPGHCTVIAELNPRRAQLNLITTAGSSVSDVTADAVPEDIAEQAARALAPVRDTSSTGGRAEIPRRVLLPELLGQANVNPESLAAGWASRRGRRGLRATLGLAMDGPFTVDLRADGPHALVAGMTGAGKSELLQTLVASLAMSYPPSRVAFLLIDYKGGAAFKDFAQLPHVVGMVTDLDAHLTARALTSLRAEMRRREGVLRAHDASDIIELERIAPDEAFPNLVLVIDEFARLVKEVPTFVDGVLDVAQAGRSLGVHLVLATQRPSGVVSEGIRANTNLRIALRVNSGADSDDVVSVSDAARIPKSMPGRAFARTGASDLSEFQAAYVGAPALLNGSRPGITIQPFAFDPGLAEIGSDGESTVIGRRLSQLSVIVSAAAEATRTHGLPTPPPPWLPPLPETVALESLESAADPAARRAGVAIAGVIDEPALQRQRTLTLDLDQDGSVLVYGSGAAGKTALLRTIAASLCMHAAPGALRLYGLDFASRGLTPLESLPQCGGIIAGDDDERVRRLLRTLAREIERRRQRVGQDGMLSLTRLQDRADPGAAERVVLLLDGYAGFAAAYERVDGGAMLDLLARIIADGRAVGVSVVATADRYRAVPAAVSAIVTCKLVLRLVDESEYSSLGIDPRVAAGTATCPGRGFASGSLEFQAALLGGDANPGAQSHALERLGRALHARFPDRQAPAVAILPPRVELTDLPAADASLTATLGLGDEDLAPIQAALRDSHFVVAGPYRSGRTTALATLARGLARSTPGLERHVLAPRRTSDLPARLDWTTLAVGDEQCLESARRLAERLASREANDESQRVPVLIVVDDGNEIPDGALASVLETLVRRGRDHDLHVALGIESGAARVTYSPWIRELRKDGHGLLLDPDPDLHGDILGVRLPRRSGPAMPPGRGYYVARGAAELVQVAFP